MKVVPIIITAFATLSLANQASADGKDVYNKACAVCHAVMPPKLGDKTAWEPRLQQGQEALIATVVNGEGAMPPKAGMPHCPRMTSRPL